MACSDAGLGWGAGASGSRPPQGLQEVQLGQIAVASGRCSAATACTSRGWAAWALQAQAWRNSMPVMPCRCCWPCCC